MASCAAIGNRRACRLPTGTQLAKLSGMGLRPTEVHENPLDRRPTVDKVSNRIGDRYPPYTRVGFRPCPTKGQLHAVVVLGHEDLDIPIPEFPAAGRTAACMRLSKSLTIQKR